MNWQLLLVAVIVATAAGYLARQTWRTWSARKSGCGGCGCGKTTSRREEGTLLLPADQLTLRRSD